MKVITKVVFLVLMVTFSINVHAQKSSWVAPKSADTVENPLKDNQSEIKKAKKLYASMCVICHGNKGKGDGIAGAALSPKPANFTSKKVQAQTDGALF